MDTGIEHLDVMRTSAPCPSRQQLGGHGREFAPDHWHVNLEEPWEVGFWTREFGCTEQGLREAVKQAGNRAGDIRAYFDGPD